MERVGDFDTGKIISYIADGLYEIGSIMPDKTSYATYSVVAGQRLYAMPNNCIKILGVYRKYNTDTDNSQITYIRIGRISHVDLIDKQTSTAADNETDIVVI